MERTSVLRRLAFILGAAVTVAAGRATTTPPESGAPPDDESDELRPASAPAPAGDLVFELDPSTLLGNEPWKIDLDADQPTRPGRGVLSYGTQDAPRSARSGRLSVTVDGHKLTGTFGAQSPDQPALASATFESRYAVDCFIAEDATAPRTAPSARAREQARSRSART